MKNYKIDNRADYAEFFEATEKFSKEKIPRGTSVVLVGDKIRPAEKDEIPFGVISSFPIMLGATGTTDAGKSWGGKYLLDEFGDFITEEAEWWSIKIKTIDKNNPNGIYNRIKRFNGWSDEKEPPKGAEKKIAKRLIVSKEYDETKKYIPRKERPEWNVVALLGKVRILKKQPVNQNWIKLRDISDNVEEWLIK